MRNSESPPSRVVIEGVYPAIDAGRFPAKGVVGDAVTVSADIFAEGHDVLNAVLKFRHQSDAEWQEVRLVPIGNDRWSGSFTPNQLGLYEYTLQAWAAPYASWLKEVKKKLEANQLLSLEWREGAEILNEASKHAEKESCSFLSMQLNSLLAEGTDQDKAKIAFNPPLMSMMEQLADRSHGTLYEPLLPLLVERERACFGAWYELFPRSGCAPPLHHNTFQEMQERLPEIAQMGFDILYLPPIHPIGSTFRRGPNNTPNVNSDDPGSPWAIGATEGGHQALHPDLGTLEEFDAFVRRAQELNLEIALDIAYQCSPDHPYVKDHPEWFRHRPDGSIKYAENPPKKYQDIYPFNFACVEWRSLWEELKNVILFWIGNGIKVFRIDNPHTKPFPFWEWLLDEVRKSHPDTIFLSEAFTRPRVMQYLAKLGFSQSYSYFTWRNTKSELTQYFTELSHGPLKEYFRPNLFANTPDILHEYLQFGGRPGFQVRLVLAATLGASYGIYGPPFELCVGQAVDHTEEYLDSEKYQIRLWDWDHPQNIKPFIARINKIRRENPALQRNFGLQFYPIDNEQIIFYGKASPDFSNIILVAVNLDPHHVQSGWVKVPFREWNLEPNTPYQVHELIGDAHYLWQGETNYIQLDPAVCPAHIFRVRRKIRTERDFDYFL